MKKALCATIATALFVVAPAAQAGQYTLHPNGFGQKSYSAWKAKQGIVADAYGGQHSLYFQKNTLTATFAAAVARIKGFEGETVESLGSVEFWWRSDGHCGAGAPRFNINTEEGMTYFVGCAAMAKGATEEGPNGTTYEQRTFDVSDLPGTVSSIVIVFDEGTDIGQGFVHLDRIRVGPKRWSEPADNGN